MTNNELEKKYGNELIKLSLIKQTTANFDFQDEDSNIKVHIELPANELPRIEREVKLGNLLKLNPKVSVKKIK